MGILGIFHRNNPPRKETAPDIHASRAAAGALSEQITLFMENECARSGSVEDLQNRIRDFSEYINRTCPLSVTIKGIDLQDIPISQSSLTPKQYNEDKFPDPGVTWQDCGFDENSPMSVLLIEEENLSIRKALRFEITPGTYARGEKKPEALQPLIIEFYVSPVLDGCNPIKARVIGEHDQGFSWKNLYDPTPTIDLKDVLDRHVRSWMKAQDQQNVPQPGQ